MWNRISRPIRQVWPKAPVAVMAQFGRFRVIVLQKSKVAELRIFAKNPNREAIADSYYLNRAAEVAYEFNVRRCGPSHRYTNSEPVALRIFEHLCKTTFATWGNSGIEPDKGTGNQLSRKV